MVLHTPKGGRPDPAGPGGSTNLNATCCLERRRNRHRSMNCSAKGSDVGGRHSVYPVHTRLRPTRVCSGAPHGGIMSFERVVLSEHAE